MLANNIVKIMLVSLLVATGLFTLFLGCHPSAKSAEYGNDSNHGLRRLGTLRAVDSGFRQLSSSQQYQEKNHRKLPLYPHYGPQPRYPRYPSHRYGDDGYYSYHQQNDDYYNDDDDSYYSEESTSVPTETEFETADDDDYVYEYKPVAPESILTTNGGYGGRKGRSIDDIRFNKCPPIIDGYSTSAWRYAPSRDYIKGVHVGVFPLSSSDYPVNGEKAKLLKRETMADSVVLPDDYMVHGANPDFWLALVDAPHYPKGGDVNAPYWDQLRHVVAVQTARRALDDPSTLSRWPDLWADFDLEDIAKAVQGEYPASLQQKLIEQLFKEGIEMNKSHGIGAPFRSVVDFVGTEILIAALNTWAIETVGPINFMLKWHVGMPRPEEMAWLIASGAFKASDGVPQDIIDSIGGMKLAHAAEFTAYMDGSPMHPSWPAMHAAGSTCSFWLPAVAKVSSEQYCEALRVDYAVAYARTVAGVHYPMDNIAGLNIGLRIIQEKLPPFMAEKYAFDEDALRTKLDELAFDWKDFDPYNCTIAGVPVGQRLLY